MGNDEKAPFLDNDDSENDAIDCEARPQQRSGSTSSIARTRGHVILLVLQTAFLLMNAALLWSNFRFTIDRGSDQRIAIEDVPEPYSPVSANIEYEIQYTGDYEDSPSPYIGEPRLELDQAWSALFEPLHVAISADEMEEMNKSSIALKDGSGYLGYLEVFHVLHCLKRFKQFRHPDYYADVFEAFPESFEESHWDHCIDTIRREVMCHAPLDVNTAAWEGDGTAVRAVSGGPRKCVKWDGIQDFARSRAIPVHKAGSLHQYLVHNDDL